MKYIRDDFVNVSKYYVTQGVHDKVPVEVVLFMMFLIENMKCDERDYFQFFTLKKCDEFIEVKHEQEVPEFTETAKLFFGDADFTELKVYIIAEDEICTILLNTEY